MEGINYEKLPRQGPSGHTHAHTHRGTHTEEHLFFKSPFNPFSLQLLERYIITITLTVKALLQVSVVMTCQELFICIVVFNLLYLNPEPPVHPAALGHAQLI